MDAWKGQLLKVKSAQIFGRSTKPLFFSSEFVSFIVKVDDLAEVSPENTDLPLK